MSTTTAAPTTPARAGHRIGVTFPRVLRSEWTKFRSLRSSGYSILTMVVLFVGLGAAIPAAQMAHWSQMAAHERATFDPTAGSLSGVFLAQLAIAVLGVLVITGEYSTGMIRASMSAVPRRLPVLWGKAVVFGAAALLVSLVSAVAAFEVGQLLYQAHSVGVSLSDPTVARAVVGAALYLTVVGLLSVGVGTLVRSSAGAIATVVGLLLVLPIIANFLPSGWGTTVQEYLPSNAGQSVMLTQPGTNQLGPWTGLAVFVGYAAAALIAAAALLRHRDT